MEKVDITEVLLPEMTILDRETFSGKEEVFAFMSEKFAENMFLTHSKHLCKIQKIPHTSIRCGRFPYTFIVS